MEPQNNSPEVEKNNSSIFKNKFISAVTKCYTSLPVNFSTLTGWRHPEIPRLKGNIILGRVPHLLQNNGILNNLKAAGELALQHESGMCYYWLGHKFVLLITQPEHIHQLLIDHNKDIWRGASFTMFRKFMGPNITVDADEAWKAKQIVYNDWLAKSTTLAAHEPKMINVVNKYIQYFDSQQNQLIDLKKIFNSYALEILLATVLLPGGHPPECIEKVLDYHAYVTREIFEYKNIFKWLLPRAISRFVFKESKQTADQVCRHMRTTLNDIFLEPNERELKHNPNFIRSIYNLTEHKNDDPLISDPNVFGDTSMMLLAGQDTNLATFQFAVKLLAANPHVEAKLHEQLTHHLKDQDFTIENISKVEYLDMVLKETLRMFPPVTVLPRDVAQPFKLGPVKLKKGDTIIFAPYITHHLKSVWERPDIFNPERFDKHHKIPPQAYLPFGAGAHMCIGQRFATQEIKLLLAAVYLNYSIEIENNDFEINLAQGALKAKVPPMAKFRRRTS